MEIIYPYNGSFRVASPYGERFFNGGTEFHRGIDMVGVSSKIICSVCSGVVESVVCVTDRSDTTWQWGLYVKVRDSLGRLWYYCHLSLALVSPGDILRPGDHIGVEGSSGYSTGSHLHLELRQSGSCVDVSSVLCIENRCQEVSPDYRGIVRARYGFSDETVDYLAGYEFGGDLIRKLAVGDRK